jgi:hypothetical protein
MNCSTEFRPTFEQGEVSAFFLVPRVPQVPILHLGSSSFGVRWLCHRFYELHTTIELTDVASTS